MSEDRSPISANQIDLGKRILMSAPGIKSSLPFTAKPTTRVTSAVQSSVHWRYRAPFVRLSLIILVLALGCPVSAALARDNRPSISRTTTPSSISPALVQTDRPLGNADQSLAVLVILFCNVVGIISGIAVVDCKWRARVHAKVDQYSQETIFFSESKAEGVLAHCLLDPGSLGKDGNYINERFLEEDLLISRGDIDTEDTVELRSIGGTASSLGSVTLKIAGIEKSANGARTHSARQRIKFHVLEGEQALFAEALLGQEYCKEKYTLTPLCLIQQDRRNASNQPRQQADVLAQQQSQKKTSREQSKNAQLRGESARQGGSSRQGSSSQQETSGRQEASGQHGGSSRQYPQRSATFPSNPNPRRPQEDPVRGAQGQRPGDSRNGSVNSASSSGQASQERRS